MFSSLERVGPTHLAKISVRIAVAPLLLSVARTVFGCVL
jgi:hypothetical protein